MGDTTRTRSSDSFQAYFSKRSHGGARRPPEHPGRYRRRRRGVGIDGLQGAQRADGRRGWHPGPDRRPAQAARLPGRLPARLRGGRPADRGPAQPLGRGTAARNHGGGQRGRHQRGRHHRALAAGVRRLARPGHRPGHRRRAVRPAPAGQRRAAPAGRRPDPASGDRPVDRARRRHPLGRHDQLARRHDRDPAPDRARPPPRSRSSAVRRACGRARPGWTATAPPCRPPGSARTRPSSAGTASRWRAGGPRPRSCSD